MQPVCISPVLDPMKANRYGQENDKMSVSTRLFLAAVVLCRLLFSGSQGWADDSVLSLQAFTVRPEPGESRLPDTTTSAIVLDAVHLEQANANHFEELIGRVPGLTWAGGTSRPRYLQMRGIGEVSHFPGEGPPNFSVGFLIDDMDMSGMGMPVSLFDIKEIEILRGPQAAIYGSRALAGLVNVQTQDPSPHHEMRLQASLGNAGYYGFGVAAGGPVLVNTELLQLRLTVEHSAMDGFRDNRALNRKDTASRNELSGRLKLRWQPSDDWRFDLAFLHADLNNGYDHFTPDNHRTRTYTDRPGKDVQESGGGSIRIHWMGAERFRILNLLSYVENRVIYSYDADWGNDEFWAGAPYSWDAEAEGYAYDFFERLDRKRRTLTQDLRLISEPGGEILGGSSAWHVGTFFSLLREEDDFEGYRLLVSDYEALSGALYGQLSSRLPLNLLLYSSLRVEQRRTDYADNEGVILEKDDTMWGGRLSLESRMDENISVFGAVSRGFKGSGVNQNPALPPEKRYYEAETLWNMETGIRATLFDRRTDIDLTLFYMIREDLQIATSMQSDPSDPTSFVYYTDNAANGFNRGIELSMMQHVSGTLQWFGTLSLLDTRYEDFESAGGVNDIEGRSQSFAPGYSYATGLSYAHHCGFFAGVEVEGRDRYYFAAGHDGRSEPYELLHLQAGWNSESWTLTLWGRNVLDKSYAVQGYFFGLEPPLYAEKLYLTYGEPARFGVTLDVRF